MSDTAPVIERLECLEHGPDHALGRRCHAMVRPYVICHRDLVPVEYVRADVCEQRVQAAADDSYTLGFRAGESAARRAA